MFRWGTDLAGSMGAANIDNENPFRAGMLGASQGGWFVFGGIEARYALTTSQLRATAQVWSTMRIATVKTQVSTM